MVADKFTDVSNCVLAFVFCLFVCACVRIHFYVFVCECVFVCMCVNRKY